jgi:hypothetical protein
VPQEEDQPAEPGLPDGHAQAIPPDRFGELTSSQHFRSLRRRHIYAVPDMMAAR